MNELSFEDFVAWSQRALAQDAPPLAACETRIARALAHLRPEIPIPATFATVHRCDLARAFVTMRGLRPEDGARALVCEGVRHALRLMFERFRMEGTLVALPSDVYPVYQRIAAETGVKTFGFATFPTLDIGRVLQRCAELGASVLLLVYPWKLHGRDWSEGETQSVLGWLAVDRGRRLILDGVYAFGERLGEPLKALLATQQTIHLDSLSKGWLAERTFGVALVPAPDRDRWIDTFRHASPSQASLYVARELIARPALPEAVRNAIAQGRARLVAALRSAGVDADLPARGYFVPLAGDARRLLAAHHVLGVPASAFGADAAWTLMSALTWSHP